ncbi:TonB-dependent receptor [Robbsia sp. KACC 23696]|uniref:TonB-dependent receptor n=1 Tax=Robbsia sp. KACC 23696 TaxID=3149231 RepID=UPI00325AFDD1
MPSPSSSSALGIALALVLTGPACAAPPLESTSEADEQEEARPESDRRRVSPRTPVPPIHAPQSPVFVTANPLGARDMISPVTTLSGDALTVRGAQSLGETLNGLPGVSTTSYGPMVGRPIIRGMDGDRIRILQNGVAALDASSLSFDHAVPQDPLSIERIEIVRGPAALLYGGNAIGGVVNTIDNRIPRSAIDGVTGVTDINVTSGNRARAAAAQIEAGNGRLNFHADVFTRKSGELRIPGFARSSELRRTDPASLAHPYGTLPNSDGQWSGGSFGGSVTWADGYAGLAYNGYTSQYGSVAEQRVRLRMRQNRLAWASEFRNLNGLFSRVKLDIAATDYLHREVDNGREHGVFQNRGFDGRLEARHRRIGPFDGAIGVQFGQYTFSTTGDHAMVPTTRTTQIALFALEEWQATDRLKMSVGGRLERATLAPTAANATTDKRFSGAKGRAFTNTSMSLGGLYQLAPAWSIATSLAYSERAPTFYEVYADGPHDATGQYLRGNANAKKEKSISADLALRFAHGTDRGSIGVFYNRFSNYLAEYNTGSRVGEAPGHSHDHDHAHGGHGQRHDHDHADGCDHAHHSLAEAEYRGVRAEFYGLEASASKRIFARGPHHVDVDLSADYTRARNADTGEPLPRISPLRLTLGAAYGHGAFGARATVVHARGQSRVPQNDTISAGYTTVGVALTYRFRVGSTQWLAYLRGDNLTNQTVRYASSVVRNVAPQMGRSATLGLRTTF